MHPWATVRSGVMEAEWHQQPALVGYMVHVDHTALPYQLRRSHRRQRQQGSSKDPANAIRQTGHDKGSFEACPFLTQNKGNPIIDNSACSRQNLQYPHSIYIILVAPCTTLSLSFHHVPILSSDHINAKGSEQLCHCQLLEAEFLHIEQSEYKEK